IDRKDWALFRTCFTPDCVVDYGRMGAWQGLDSLTEAMDAMHAPMSRTAHRMSNVAVEVDGDDATGCAYVHAVLVDREDSRRVWEAVGWSADRCRRTPAGWRIAERRYTMVRWSPPAD